MFQPPARSKASSLHWFFCGKSLLYSVVILAVQGAAVASSLETTTTPSTTAQGDSFGSSATGIMTTPTGAAARLARPNILELHPYRCARDDYSDGILLDANENAYGPPTKGHNNHDDNNIVLERYPDPYQIPLKEKFATFRGVEGITAAHMFVGVGSDEAIDLLMRIFCRPGGADQILTTPPTYGMYKVCAKVNDVPIVTVPLQSNFDLNVPQILEAITPSIKLLFLCSPGNPTAKALPLSDVEAIVSSPQCANTVVVVDEAYVDYSSHGTALSLILKYPNVVVLQTLSKAFGLAAIRCGFCFGPPDIVQLLNNVKAPYNVNALTSEMALQALNHVDTLQSNIAQTLEQRQVVADALTAMEGVVTHVYPSDANFLLFRLRSHAQQVYTRMAEGAAGVVTRYRGSELHCDECIRVTIGTPTENQAFLKALPETYAAVVAEAEAAK